MAKFLLSLFIITTLSLSYVSQQVKLVEYSYSINNNTRDLSLLIDDNERLRYNVASLRTPLSLKQTLANNNINLDTPQDWHKIRLARTEQKNSRNELTYESSFKIAARVLLNILTPDSEAIAQELDQP